MPVPDLVLDPALKLWVLLPISVVMVLVGILRSYISVLLQPKMKLQDYRLVREQQHLARLRTYRRNYSIFWTKQELQNRIDFFISEYSGTKYLKELPPSDPNEIKNPLADANSSDLLLQMVKNNFANYVPQTLIMWWVNYFFKGYVVMRLPFNLTGNFKSMLQQSIDTTDLDVTYVSSISWYFVNLLGLKSIYSLLLDDGDIVNQLMAQQQQQPMVPPIAGAGPSADKQFKAELENLQIVPFKSCLEGIESRFAEKWG
ncbi:hypothetical protein KL905_002120 [Ogataea polymorpha]|uniref:ER membrane protein complex subunit 3 n=1 Tax=Ogataea polymorpha TaxID=460523 RepID=A0A1B7SCE8_9ASCO|nr:uncharacterized protein OGAPODRAFT_102115 [Ogataea polymorpha]KAG7881014.1 hypothetical protein KL937_001861 [Ogataea polymorpha]KAG7905728.1 hypothetical protein KL907_002875 [Ogataea polymorpha]KAG7909629.1 hypothetical protein KL906_002385 [Ogataea polymorpha]KAG7917151.1 hypothetical protein KL927_002925 [Ogataea polymorpha]KAG7922098.1 hypothetical protein KL905_002120 [Ogataea polymorpha]